MDIPDSPEVREKREHFASLQARAIDLELAAESLWDDVERAERSLDPIAQHIRELNGWGADKEDEVAANLRRVVGWDMFDATLPQLFRASIG